jgi:hypothetical protein
LVVVTSHRQSRSERFLWVAGGLFAVLPVASCLMQYSMSVRAGTESCFFRNYTVAYVDWLFVPFNLVVVRTIDWRRGGRLFLGLFASVLLNIIGHAFWQYHGIDGGHMITRDTQIVLPAGWVHLGFSSIEGAMLLAFVFVRKPCPPYTAVATVLALAYFVSEGVSGYVINHGLIATDAIIVLSGMFFLVVYPHLAGYTMKPSQPHVVRRESQ